MSSLRSNSQTHPTSSKTQNPHIAVELEPMSSIVTSPTTPLPLNSTTINATLLPFLSSSSPSASLYCLKQIHAQILRSNLSHSILLKLIISSSSSSISSLSYALSVFNHLPSTPHPPLSNNLLRALSRSSKPETVLLLYVKIRENGLFGLDRFSFPFLLQAAAKVGAVNEGMEIHGAVAKLGFDKDPFLQTGLMSLYVGCGKILEARLVFDKMSYRDVVSWSVMINGYCHSGLFDDALQLFEEMRRSNVEPDKMVLSTIISACARAGNLSYGKEVHNFLIENDIVLDPHLVSGLISLYASCGCMDMAKELFTNMSSRNLVVSTTMVSGYLKVGKIEDARLIFNQIYEKDLICWSVMISGYAESDQPQEAINLFNEMKILGVQPDEVTMLSVISACAHLGVLDQAKQIHRIVDESGFGKVLSVNNALVDMYAKCGCLGAATAVFEKMERRNVISWTSMINAFAIHGDAHNALNYFHQMKVEDIEPNAVTFIGLLYACSHAGLVEEGQKIFASMINEHNITPKQEHYGCMVDLFGRAKLIREALNLVETMPLAPNVVIWGSLMAACRVHGEIELGEFAAKRVLELEPDHDGALVFLSNVYAKEKQWQDVGELRNLMKKRGIVKERGYSRIELTNGVHEFSVADRKHEQADEIYEKLDEVVKKLKLVGYCPNTSSVLVDLEEEIKEEVVLWHSEKLALSYGLISGAKGSCIRIVKNLRVCDDCHCFMKMISKVYETEIVIRDRTRFHHFKHGLCSCNDYW
ncbi:pentatricopeptide repeat-containing protein At4g14820 [Mercurialis annua]|uniref:pentatricopeptide repeat-containing protein At4g14820 n=1 Tax=Mercurialis annua TaxID=3986 RepID=UPI00216076DE|nr:pentatricopeptide repeat-containing protein At4g14820 [Mercurialis annua]